MGEVGGGKLRIFRVIDEVIDICWMMKVVCGDDDDGGRRNQNIPLRVLSRKNRNQE